MHEVQFQVDLYRGTSATATGTVDLARAWRAWTSDAHTSELLGDIEWPVHPMVGPLILDAEALAGDADGDLFGLDQVAAEAAGPAQRNIEAERAVLNAADKAGRERERTLRSKRADLVAERDRKPGDPPWVDPERPGEPLWRCVEFTPGLTSAGHKAQAGLEGDLLASTADRGHPTGRRDGRRRRRGAARSGGRPRRALSVALRPDPAAVLPGDVIAAVLAGVGFDDQAAATSVSADGSWRNGPLRGRHVTDRARHIGAAARAAHRMERIAQIDAELADLARAAEERARQRARLDALADRIDALVRAAPRTADLHAARWQRAGVSTDEISGTVITWALRPPGRDRWSAMMRERADLGLVTHLTVHELRSAADLTRPGEIIHACETPKCCSDWRRRAWNIRWPACPAARRQLA